MHAIEFADADARRRRLERERAQDEKANPVRALVVALRDLAEPAGRLENAAALAASGFPGADRLLAQALQAARSELAAATERLNELEDPGPDAAT